MKCFKNSSPILTHNNRSWAGRAPGEVAVHGAVGGPVAELAAARAAGPLLPSGGGEAFSTVGRLRSGHARTRGDNRGARRCPTGFSCAGQNSMY